MKKGGVVMRSKRAAVPGYPLVRKRDPTSSLLLETRDVRCETQNARQELRAPRAKVCMLYSLIYILYIYVSSSVRV